MALKLEIPSNPIWQHHENGHSLVTIRIVTNRKDVRFMKGSSKELGQGLVEYAFLFLLIVIVVIVTLRVLGFSVLDVYEGTVSILMETFS